MQLLFTGSDTYLGQQKDIEKSLGGFVSSTPIPNNRINGLFTDISEYGKENQVSEVIGISLFNNSGADVNNLKLTQIYSNNFLEDDNDAIFEWAIVSLSSGKMEKISSKRDLPFVGEFVSLTSRRADAVLKILSGGAIGDTVSVLGVESEPITSGAIENLVDSIIKSFIGNSNYICIKKSSSEIYFKCKNYGVNITPIELTSTGSASAISTSFNNGVNGQALLVETLANDKGIGIWIKRTIKAKVNISPELLLSSFGSIPKTIESLEVIFDWEVPILD